MGHGSARGLRPATSIQLPRNWQALGAEWLPKTWSTRFLSSPLAAGIEGCWDAGQGSQGYVIYMFYCFKRAVNWCLVWNYKLKKNICWGFLDVQLWFPWNSSPAQVHLMGRFMVGFVVGAAASSRDRVMPPLGGRSTVMRKMPWGAFWMWDCRHQGGSCVRGVMRLNCAVWESGGVLVPEIWGSSRREQGDGEREEGHQWKLGLGCRRKKSRKQFLKSRVV